MSSATTGASRTEAGPLLETASSSQAASPQSSIIACDTIAENSIEHSEVRVLKVNYVFCGPSRRSDLYECLCKLQVPYNFVLVMILDDSTCEDLLRDIDRREFDVNIVTPPCDTLSGKRRVEDSSRPQATALLEMAEGIPMAA